MDISRFQKNIIFYIFPLLAFLLVLAGTSKYGIGFTFDSYSYVKNAFGLSHNYGLLKFDYLFPGVWPPFYSIFIALFYKLHLDINNAACYFNAILYAITIFYTLKLLEIIHIPLKHSILYALLVVIAYPVFANYLYALSEPLFITICTVTLYYIIRLNQHFTRPVFLGLIFLSVAAILTRYVGISLFISTSISIYYISKKYFAKASYAIYYVLSTAALFSLWLLRNYYLTQTFTGKGRGGTGYIFYDSFISILQVLNHWFVPSIFNFNTSLFIIFLLAAFIFYCYLAIPKKSRVNINHLLIFTFCYLIIIYLCGALKYCNVPDDRLLSPIFIPLSITIFTSIYFRVKTFKGFFKKYTYATFAVILSIYSYTFLLGIFELAGAVVNGAGGYTQTEFLNKAGIKWLKSNQKNIPVYTNLVEPVYLITGTNARKLPELNKLNAIELKNSFLTDSVIIVLLKLGDSHIKSNRKILQQIMGNDIKVTPPDIKVYNISIGKDHFTEYKSYFSTIHKKDSTVEAIKLLSTEDSEIYLLKNSN